MTIQDLPTINASLNGLSAVFLTIGYVLIKRGSKEGHRNCMVAALITSTIFLACYLTYHELLRRTTGSDMNRTPRRAGVESCSAFILRDICMQLTGQRVKMTSATQTCPSKLDKAVTWPSWLVSEKSGT